MIIVSLSSIPPRFGMLGPTLRALLNQTRKIDQIRVNIPRHYRRFPDHAFTRPELPEGVELRICEEDYGPATKVLPALADNAGTDARIIFCDDDRICHPNWAGNLIDKSDERPEDCITNSGWDLNVLGFDSGKGMPEPRAQHPHSFDLPYRLRRLRQKLKEKATGQRIPKPPRSRLFDPEGYLDILEGCGGVLVRPSMFDARVFNVPPKVWTVDDIWLSGMLAANGVRIWANGNGIVPTELPDARGDSLSENVIEGLNRQQANIACIHYLQEEFGVWQDRKLADA